MGSSAALRKAGRVKKRKPAGRSSAPVFSSVVQGTVTGAVSDVEKVRLQQALLRSERRYRSLVHATSQVVWATSAEGDVVEDLPTWRAFTGQSVQEIMGRGWMMAVHADDIEGVGKIWEASLKAKTPHTQEFRVRRHDGVFRLMHAHAVPILDDDGDVQEWIGTCTDITDQRQHDEKSTFLATASDVLASSLEYESTLRNVAELVVPRLAEWCTVHIRNEDGSIEQLAIAHADPAMLELAKNLQKKYPPDYNAPHGIGHVLRTGTAELGSEITDAMLQRSARDPEHLQILRKLRLGSYMSVPLIARDRVVGVISFLTVAGRHYTKEDLAFAEQLASRAALAVDNARLYRNTQQAFEEVRVLNESLEEKVARRTEELRIAQQKDHANFQRMRFMIRHLPLAATALDENEMILEINPLFCEMLGLRSRPADMLQHKRDEFVDEWKGNVVDYEHHADRLTDARKKLQPLYGQEITMTDGRILLRDFIPILEEGRFHGSLIIYRDVTQERRIDATKSEFMSLASHQLRTPLTAIRWIFGRLAKNLEGRLGSLEEGLLQDGRKATARMSDTITTMLQISRIQADQVQLNRQQIPLRDFLEELADVYSEESARKGQTVAIECSSDLLLFTDPQLLREALGNLVNNAVKYTPKNGRLSLYAEKQGNSIRINVQDSGYGIPLHQQSKVFDKFFRGDNILSKDPDGTGLGLHMVSLITELLGGAIVFESAEGRGTTFRLTLPAA